MRKIFFLVLVALILAPRHAQAQEQPALDGLIRAAEEHEAAGRMKEAVEAWKLVAVQAPSDRPADGHRALGRLRDILQPAGSFEELETAIRAAVDSHPGASWALGYLAAVQQIRGRDAEALETYLKIADAGGNEGGWASYYAGTLLVKDPLTRLEAADAFVESIRMSPDLRVPGKDAVFMANYVALEMVAARRFEQARAIWEGMLALPGIEPAKRARVCFFVAMLDYRFGRFQQAEGSVLAAMDLAPDNAEYVSNLGLVYLSWGKPEKARETWLRALELNPSYADAVENLAVWHMKRGDRDKAREYYVRGHGLAHKALAVAAENLRLARENNSPDTQDMETAFNDARRRLFSFETYLRKQALRSE